MFNGNFEVLGDGGTLTIKKDAGTGAEMILQITMIMWFMMHYIGGVIRSMIYIEPLYQIPDDPDQAEVWVILCQRLGP